MIPALGSAHLAPRLWGRPRFGETSGPEGPDQSSLITERQGAKGLELLNHSSYFLRDPDCWVHLTNLLAQDFPKGVLIEDYVGAQGQDSLSLAVCTEAKFQRKSYLYPIRVSDKAPQNLLRGRLGLVNYIPVENPQEGQLHIPAIQMLKDAWAWMQARLHTTEPLFQWVSLEPVEHLPRHLQTQNPQGLRDDWQASLDKERVFALRPRFQKQLAHRVSFNPDSVDLVGALACPPPNPKLPRAVLMRNVVYLLPLEDRTRLLKALSNHFAVGSVLVLGHSETEMQYAHDPRYINRPAFDSTTFQQQLRRAGWKPEPECPLIWRKIQ